jgi:hypothetical protein
VDVQKFFKAAYAAHRARLMAYLGVEFHLPVQQSSLEYIVNNFPSSERFRWWIQEGSSVSPESIAARLAPFVEGKIPLWRV